MFTDKAQLADWVETPYLTFRKNRNSEETTPLHHHPSSSSSSFPQTRRPHKYKPPNWHHLLHKANTALLACNIAWLATFALAWLFRATLSHFIDWDGLPCAEEGGVVAVSGYTCEGDGGLAFGVFGECGGEFGGWGVVGVEGEGEESWAVVAGCAGWWVVSWGRGGGRFEKGFLRILIVWWLFSVVDFFWRWEYLSSVLILDLTFGIKERKSKKCLRLCAVFSSNSIDFFPLKNTPSILIPHKRDKDDSNFRETSMVIKYLGRTFYWRKRVR